MSNPKYPVYVISKGRWESRLTAKALELRNIPFWVVIEPQEYNHYSAVIPANRILMLPFSNLGQGSIPARNWVWEDSIKRGYARHWILDDNIYFFARLHKNIKYYTDSGATFAAIEDWCDRYTNVALAGMQYEHFVPRKKNHPPIIFNTRIYSCILIDNGLPYRWRGLYNEDTDLSLRALKGGYCTALFVAFLAKKVWTQQMKGGNTDELYAKTHDRLEFAQSLQQQHPDVVKVVRKYGRWHHQVDYRPFKGNKLIRRPDVEIPQGVNNYGMVLVNKGDDSNKSKNE
jgi:hypothetical protein